MTSSLELYHPPHVQAELSPHVPIISEENKQLPYSVRKGQRLQGRGRPGFDCSHFTAESCAAMPRCLCHQRMLTCDCDHVHYYPGYQYCWLVDPLDGTKEFIKRNDQFTVNIALIQVPGGAQARQSLLFLNPHHGTVPVLLQAAAISSNSVAQKHTLLNPQGSTAVMGVLHVPVSGDTFFALQGRGAFVRRQVRRGRRGQERAGAGSAQQGSHM